MDTRCFEELGFRDLYGKVAFIEYPMQDLLREGCGADLPDDADGALVYGYIDATAGLTFEVLALARMSELMAYSDLDMMRVLNYSAKLHAGAVLPDATVAMPPDQDPFVDAYAKHIALIDKFYGPDEELVDTRGDAFLDHLRHPYFPEDVRVLLHIEGTGDELVWVTLKGYSDENEFYYGKMLNEPDTDCGNHNGDLVAFLPVRFKGEGELALVTTPKLKLVAGDE